MTYTPRYVYSGRISGPNYVKITETVENDHPVQSKVDLKSAINVCMLVAYSGTNYLGSQRQPWKTARNTIEEQLINALVKSNWIPAEAYFSPWKVNFQRTSRTDSGVSAARQCFSLLLPKKTLTDIEAINKFLPNDIRILGLKQVPKSFEPRRDADARTYSYTLPTIAFSHYNDQSSLRDFRLSADKLVLVNETLQFYRGAKNFHNFTTKKEHFETNSMRCMIHLECDQPFIVDDVEFSVVRIKGHSFMMHQIRKMIGLLLAVVREVTDASVFPRAFSQHTVDIPTAPGLGLVLDQIHFDKFNQSHCRKMHFEELDWGEYDEIVNNFRQNFIHPVITRTEIEKEAMYNWVETLLCQSFDVVPEDQRGLVRNPKGSISSDDESEINNSEADNKQKYIV